MRLFIAINFPEDIKTKLYNIAANLKDESRYGNFSRRENLHLTLVFIGETPRFSDVVDVMKKTSFESFDIELSSLGKFKRNGGDIYWIGVKKSAVLLRIASELSNNLKAAGFKIDVREFKPHLTLGREVVMYDGFNMSKFSDTIEPMLVNVPYISLMKSERISGRLTYTEIYRLNSKGV